VTAPAPEPVRQAEDWERVVTGSAARLLDSYFVQLKHRRRVETTQVVLEAFGPFLGFVVVLVALFIAVWLIDRGHSLAGAVLGTVDLVGFFAVVVLLLLGGRGNTEGPA
jgi:hypothetical protein